MEILLILFAVVAVVAVIIVQSGRRSLVLQPTQSQQPPPSQPSGNVAATPTNTSGTLSGTPRTPRTPPTPPAATTFPMPEPEIVSTNGLNRVPAYAHRLMQSQKTAAVLMISLLDGEGSLSILRMGSGQIQFHLLANWPQSSDKQQNAQMFFTRHHILWSEEQRDGSRLLMFPLSGDATTVTNMAQATLTQVIGVDSNAGLKFRYEERDL